MCCACFFCPGCKLFWRPDHIVSPPCGVEQVVLEECVEGWAIWQFSGHDECNEHNHPLVTTRQQANAEKAFRFVPLELVPLGEVATRC